MPSTQLPSQQLSSLIFNIGGGAVSTIFYQQFISSSLLSLTMAEMCPASTSFGNIPLSSKSEYYSSPAPLKIPSLISSNNFSITKKNIINQKTNELTSNSSILSNFMPNLYVSTLIKPAKICPDFKDDADQSACCPSQITQGAYYCCTEEHRAQLQWELDKEAWSEFIENNISIIVIGLILFSLAFIVLTILLCKRFSFCPLYQPNSSLHSTIGIIQQNQNNRRYSFTPSRYHLRPLISSTYNQIGTTNSFHFPHYHSQQPILHKPPSHYEAPPPYEFVVALPPPHLQHTPFNLERSSHDWECITENELNDIHQATIVDNVLTTA